MMKKAIFFFQILIIICFQLQAQEGQIEINRVKQMPAMPTPYKMRNWKDVAQKYDDLVFSLNATGQHLPLIGLKASGNNYPALKPILLQTYVGSNSTNQAEAINIIPAIVGATLNGIDKSSQGGINWVEKVKDFYNKKNGQRVYLNGYDATSGKDWWYDVMPNVFFYQLYSQYPSIPDFDEQFVTIADRWLEAINTMGGSSKPWTVPQMNYRAFNLNTMTPLDEGVKEPEAAGAIGWLLYSAYVKTGDKKYLHGAEMSIEFLSGLNSNPSYELQLPYGVLTAARLNAEYGANYDLNKMLNWCFDKGELRGWGTIVGKWNGADVSGIIGEANDQGNDYAFLMNGFQQAAALVPMIRYDKKYARDLAKWVLNLSNASRLFYPGFLPSESQDDHQWSSQYDPESVIGYEALKENLQGKKLYGTGDAKRNDWAKTNLGIYGSSHVGYLGAIVETTDVEGILKLNLNKTNFFGSQPFPAYVLYNPHSTAQQVTLTLGSNSYDIYDAITETTIASNVTADYKLSIEASNVRLLVYLPANSTTVPREGKLYLDDQIVDYHYGYNFQGKLRIKSLTADTNVVGFNKVVPIYAKTENATEAITYRWFVNGALIASNEDEAFNWTVPSAEGSYYLKLEASSGESIASDSLLMTVMERVPLKTSIVSLKQDKPYYYAGEKAKIICEVINDEKDQLSYEWIASSGTFTQLDSLVEYQAPSTPGVYSIAVKVTNPFQLQSSFTTDILVKTPKQEDAEPLAYYPLNGEVKDYSGNGYDAQLDGAIPTKDARDSLNHAYHFSSPTDIIFVPQTPAFNFQDAVTLSFWVKADEINAEAFILSHGSYEERWKISLTPSKKLRWTLKTANGVKDLDSREPIELHKFYHVTVVFSGYSMEMYIDGALNSFNAHAGPISITLQPITFARKTKDEKLYSLKGTIDEVRLYDVALDPSQISGLKSKWSEEIVSGNEEDRNSNIFIYPNPSLNNIIHISGVNGTSKIELTDVSGRKIKFLLSTHAAAREVRVDDNFKGIAILKVQSGTTLIRKIVILE